MTQESNSEVDDWGECPPDIRGYIAAMESLMYEDRSCNHAGVPSQLAIDLMKRGAVSSFAQFEVWLRQMSSKVHFIAAPLDFFGPDWSDKTSYPLGVEGDPEYTLWVGVNGSNEAKELLTRLGISAGENTQRLLTTGVLTAG